MDGLPLGAAAEMAPSPSRSPAGWGPAGWGIERAIDAWLGLRDRLVGSAKFRRWAAGFPLTRPIARRRTRALFDLCAGFVYAQILSACVRLSLFDILADGPQAPENLAPRLGLSRAATARLLAAAASLGLLDRRRGGRFGLGPLGAAMVGNRGIAEMVLHHERLYADLADPLALLRAEAPAGALAAYWPYAAAGSPDALPSDDVAPYTRLMAASLPMVADEVLDAYPLNRHRALLDVGGGNGSFLIEAAARAPALRLMLFDLPAVAAQARQRFADARLGGRAVAVAGDVHADPLPLGADIASLVRVVHDHDDQPALAILRSVHRALPPGGTLLLAEPMSGTPGAEPVGDAYFGFYLLAMGSGRPRTAGELAAMIEQAGFVRVRRKATRVPLLTSLLVATRP